MSDMFFIGNGRAITELEGYFWDHDYDYGDFLASKDTSNGGERLSLTCFFPDNVDKLRKGRWRITVEFEPEESK